MLDIVFYSRSKQKPEYVEMSEDFYLWLAKSEFSKIGESELTKIELDGEVLTLSLVHLGDRNRPYFSKFLREEIVEESDVVLEQFSNANLKEDYQCLTYRLRKLQELRKCVENKNYQYLQRV